MIDRLFAKLFPTKLRQSYTQLLRYTGVKVNADAYIGRMVLAGILIGFLAAFATNYFFTKISIWILWPAYFLLIETIIYVPIMLKVDMHAKEIENILPDALQLMFSNMKSGLTVEQSLLASARPEFGPFEKELNSIGKQVATGKPLEFALLDSTQRVSSEKYRKTMELLASGLRSGGEIAKLLDQASASLKHQKMVDQKVRSNVMMYVIFIFSAICFGAPILFGLSSFLVEVISQIFGQIDIPAAASQKFSMPMVSFSGAEGVSKEFVMTYMLSSMTISAIMGGFIIGLISKGKEKYGFRYIPILIIFSIVMFLLVRLAVSNLMGSILTL